MEITKIQTGLKEQEQDKDMVLPLKMSSYLIKKELGIKKICY
jgi:hypothetical protein